MDAQRKGGGRFDCASQLSAWVGPPLPTPTTKKPFGSVYLGRGRREGRTTFLAIVSTTNERGDKNQTSSALLFAIPPFRTCFWYARGSDVFEGWVTARWAYLEAVKKTKPSILPSPFLFLPHTQAVRNNSKATGKVTRQKRREQMGPLLRLRLWAPPHSTR